MTLIGVFIALVAQALSLAIFARAILSWFPVNPGGPLMVVLYQLTEPILAPLRRIIPPLGGMVDITPLIAILLLQGLQYLAAGMF